MTNTAISEKVEEFMKIKFYGVRGSYPVPGNSTVSYGGNTTCVSVTKEVDGKICRLVIDSGTGIIRLGKDILENYSVNKNEDLNLIVLFTHLHPDHIQGFPFFSPNYFTNCQIHLMGMKTLKKHVGSVLEQSMLPPTFPIEYKDLKSKRIHYELKDGLRLYIDKNKRFHLDTAKIDMNDVVFYVDVMQAFAPSHPQQGSLYYKITDHDTKKTLSCVWDLESHPGGDKAVVKFIKDSDVIIHDTQYTDEEYQSTEMIVQGFGHSTYRMAVENALQACVKDKVLCTHYNPVHGDLKLDCIQAEMTALKKDQNLPFDIILAKEGMEIGI
jgi:ribonuclease BN (tRNA processing enzyme)